MSLWTKNFVGVPSGRTIARTIRWPATPSTTTDHFAPLMRYPSGARPATVATCRGLESASGSVTALAPRRSPRFSGRRYHSGRSGVETSTTVAVGRHTATHRSLASVPGSSSPVTCLTQLRRAPPRAAVAFIACGPLSGPVRRRAALSSGHRPLSASHSSSWTAIFRARSTAPSLSSARRGQYEKSMGHLSVSASSDRLGGRQRPCVQQALSRGRERGGGGEGGGRGRRGSHPARPEGGATCGTTMR